MNKYALFSVLLIFIGYTELNAGGFQINLQGHRSVGMVGHLPLFVQMPLLYFTILEQLLLYMEII